MKVSNFLTLISSLVLVSACGSNNASTQSLPLVSGQTGVYSGAGCGSGSPPGVSLSSVPLYSGNAFIGYKINYGVGGYSVIGNQTSFQTSYPVCAGDQILVNSAGVTYGSASAYCSNGVLTTSINSNLGGTVSNLTANVNGQVISSGSTATVTQSGTLVVSGSFPAIDRPCGWPYGGSPTIFSYYVNLAQGITLQRCTNTAGAAITCPY